MDQRKRETDTKELFLRVKNTLKEQFSRVYYNDDLDVITCRLGKSKKIDICRDGDLYTLSQECKDVIYDDDHYTLSGTCYKFREAILENNVEDSLIKMIREINVSE